jgi:hypothetical protein
VEAVATFGGFLIGMFLIPEGFALVYELIFSLDLSVELLAQERLEMIFIAG